MMIYITFTEISSVGTTDITDEELDTPSVDEDYVDRTRANSQERVEDKNIEKVGTHLL